MLEAGNGKEALGGMLWNRSPGIRAFVPSLGLASTAAVLDNAAYVATVAAVDVDGIARALDAVPPAGRLRTVEERCDATV